MKQKKVGDLELGQKVWVVLNYTSNKLFNSPNLAMATVTRKFSAHCVILFEDANIVNKTTYINVNLHLNRIRKELVEEKHKTLDEDGKWTTFYFIAVATNPEMASILFLQYIKLRQERFKYFIRNLVMKKKPNYQVGMNEDGDYKMVNVLSMSLTNLGKDVNTDTINKIVNNSDVILKDVEGTQILEFHGFIIGPMPRYSNSNHSALFKEILRKYKLAEARLAKELKEFMQHS